MAPRSVFLMRHAEKPDDPEDPDLAPAGVERAKHLANWLPSIRGARPNSFSPPHCRSTARAPTRR